MEDCGVPELLYGSDTSSDGEDWEEDDERQRQPAELWTEAKSSELAAFNPLAGHGCAAHGGTTSSRQRPPPSSQAQQSHIKVVALAAMLLLDRAAAQGSNPSHMCTEARWSQRAEAVQAVEASVGGDLAVAARLVRREGGPRRA